MTEQESYLPQLEEGSASSATATSPAAAPVRHDKEISNKTFRYMNEVEKVKGHLSKQYPTIANPAPLGLCGFALTTFVLSMMNAGAIVDISSPQGVVMGLALFYGGLVQLLAGMWEFKTGNTFGAVAFSSYGGFWMSLAALNIKAFGFMEGFNTDPKATKDINDSLGIYLLGWAIFSLIMTIASHRTTICLMTLFFTVFLTFLMLSIGHFEGGNLHLKRAGGAFGLIASALAWYAAAAALMTSKISFISLPVGKLDRIYRRMGWLNDEEEEEEKSN